MANLKMLMLLSQVHAVQKDGRRIDRWLSKDGFDEYWLDTQDASQCQVEIKCMYDFGPSNDYYLKLEWLKERIAELNSAIDEDAREEEAYSNDGE